MAWLDLFNKVFPETKPKKKKKQIGWTPDPKYFENELKRKLKKKRNTEFKLRIDRFRKDNYIKYEKESRADKLEREAQNHFMISDLGKRSKTEVDDPLEKMETRLRVSSQTDSGLIWKKERKVREEYVIERLIRMRYVYSNPSDPKEREIRNKQLGSLKPWIDYLKGLPNLDVKFAYLVLGTILKYDLYWMEKNEDGAFRTGERSKGTKKEFPIFDPDQSPVIIGFLKDCISFLLEINDPKADFNGITHTRFQNLFAGDVDSLKKAYGNGDIREMYFILKEHVETSQIKESQIEGIEKEEWLPAFSFRNCETEEEKNEVAKSLAKATKYSRGFCIKSIITAYEYLSKGDIYLYYSTKQIRRKDGRLQDLGIPEIAIHILREQVNVKGSIMETERINPKEIHGNGPNQGINKAYLGVARKWIAESEFENRDEFEVKFADAEMFAIVEDKIDKLPEGEDLNARELKFLYQLYRSFQTFELNNSFGNKIFNLVSIREMEIQKKIQKGINNESLGEKHNDVVTQSEGEMKRNDYAKMFSCKKENVIIGSYVDQSRKGLLEYKNSLSKPGLTVLDASMFLGYYHEDEFDFEEGFFSNSLQVVIGNVEIGDCPSLKNIREICGKLKNLRHEMKLKDLGQLKKVSGIELTEEDKVKILSGKISQFPMPNDPRLKKIFY